MFAELYLVVQVHRGNQGLHPHRVWCKVAHGLVVVIYKLAIIHFINFNSEHSRNFTCKTQLHTFY